MILTGMKPFKELRPFDNYGILLMITLWKKEKKEIKPLYFNDLKQRKGQLKSLSDNSLIKIKLKLLLINTTAKINHLQTEQLPPFWLQFLQWLQFLHALHCPVGEHLAQTFASALGIKEKK